MDAPTTPIRSTPRLGSIGDAITPAHAGGLIALAAIGALVVIRVLFRGAVGD